MDRIADGFLKVLDAVGAFKPNELENVKLGSRHDSRLSSVNFNKLKEN
jgi:hypothetical protein